MAAKPEELPSKDYVAEFYLKTFEFPAGFLTEYKPSELTTDTVHQDLAKGMKLASVSNAKVSRFGYQPVAPGPLAKLMVAGAFMSSGISMPRQIVKIKRTSLVWLATMPTRQ